MTAKLNSFIGVFTGGDSASARSRRLKVLSYLILGSLAIFYIWPLIMLISTSLKPLTEYLKNPAGLPTAPTLANFAEAWELANFPQYLLNSAYYTATATAIFIVSSLFVAFPIARDYFKGSNIILTLYVIALFLPPALIPQFQLILNLGLYNTRPGYILLFLINPIGMIIIVNYIKSIPRELDEAAAVDGASYLRYVLTIIFPLIRPAIATVTVLHAIGIWNEVILPTIYLTNADLYPITRGLIVFQGVYGNNWPGIAAAVLMLMLPLLILFMFLQRYIISGLTAGAVKG
jgi:raffinose/stachyose/melibiose transport system permease protein